MSTGPALVVAVFLALVLVDVLLARSATARWEQEEGATTGDGVHRRGPTARAPATGTGDLAGAHHPLPPRPRASTESAGGPTGIAPRVGA